MAHVPLLPDEVRADLEIRHAEPHRRYHTMVHVRHVLAEVDALLADHAVADPDAVRLAAWFHDAVYDPRSATNEADSAELAARMLGDGRHHARVPAVRRLVMATAGHRPGSEPGDESEAVLVDADLAILAAAPDAYDRYVAAVRAEYAHLDDARWRAGRAAFLTSLLARPRLFTLRGGEADARANISREVAGLRLAPA
jgi:predicted metal-dependent HD superfamily phosphohydrolase